MLKNVLTLILGIFILSSCSSGPDGYFKRSANNKLFDRQGFKGGKRSPLYNKKYIEKAKYNVVTNNLDEDDIDMDSEYDPSSRENIILENREMYRRMVEEEMDSRGRQRHSKRQNYNDMSYPSISKANSSFYEDRNDSADLKKELDEIKSMLNEAKRDMSSRQCPSAAAIEKQNPVNRIGQPYNAGSASKTKAPAANSTIIEPVKAI